VALSGGIDSISVACACRRVFPDTELHTFTAGSGPDDPKVRTAGQVAAAIGSEHHVVVTRPRGRCSLCVQIYIIARKDRGSEGRIPP
jgi:asparagine synthetase B (glutamine-hydrolysing)